MMDPVETLAKAIWESSGSANEYPWQTLRGKPRAAMMGVARDVIFAVTAALDFLKNENPEDPDAG